MNQRSHRYWIPISLLAFAIATLTFAYSQSELDTNLRSWMISATLLLTSLLLALWFILLSGFSTRVRLRAFIGLVVAMLTFMLTLKVDGSVSGTGLPRFTWAWTKPGERHLARPITTEVAQPSLTDLPDLPDVPQFLGTNLDGILPDPGLASDWQATPPREAWRSDIGEGWGAFCVVSGRAITQEQRDQEEWVSAYDLATGKLLWHHADKTRFVEWQGGDGPRATPTHDAGKLYTQGATGILNCLEVATGKLLWTHDLQKENNTGVLTWGFASSPLIVDNLVIVCGAKRSGPTLIAYDKVNGELEWKSGTDEATYGSPIVATMAGKRMLITNNASGLAFYDPASGAVLMEHAWGNDKFPKASQPLVLPGDRVFLSAGYGMGCTLLQIKATTDGKFTAEELWRNNKMKTQFNSVTPIGDMLYGLDDGRLAAIDIATGERLWKEGRFGAGQHLLVGNKVLIQSEQGPVHLAEVTRAGFKELAKLDALSSKTWNYPTLAGKWLLVRNDKQVACYELPLATK
jgi:outer membrane protein assembly factor BamB